MACELDVVLREEIMACQQARADFLKWKLILVAGVGAAGVGLLQAGMQPAPVLLALVPFIGVYVDAVCLHNDSRIMMIATFMRESPHVSDAAREYEAMCQRERHRFYSEWAVMYLSTGGLSLLVFGLGLLARLWPDLIAPLVVVEPVGYVLMVSGVAGLAATWGLVRSHQRIRSGEPPMRLLPREAAARGSVAGAAAGGAATGTSAAAPTATTSPDPRGR